MVFAGMYLAYIYFSDFNESYETFVNACTQICLLTHIEISGFEGRSLQSIKFVYR